MTSAIDSLQITDDDIRMILVTGAYKWPSRNYCHQMKQYIYEGKVNDEFLVINIRKMWEKLCLAARAIAAIDNPGDICVVGIKSDVQRAILKFAHYTGAVAIAGRFTPGSFTNQITKAFKEPRLIIVSDPKEDGQAIREASYVNIPVIAFADPSSSISCVDIVIPCNMETHYASGLMWWLLCREVLRLKGSISRETKWSVMVDLFIHREQEATRGVQAPTQEFVEQEKKQVDQQQMLFGVQEPSQPQSSGFLEDAFHDDLWLNEGDTSSFPTGVWTASQQPPY